MINTNEIPDEEVAVRLDTAVESRIACEAAAQDLREMYVTLDGMADEHNTPGRYDSHVRDIQDDVQTLKRLYESYAQAAARAEEALRERHEAAQNDAG